MDDYTPPNDYIERYNTFSDERLKQRITTIPDTIQRLVDLSTTT